MTQNKPLPLRSDWNVVQPEPLPRPTYCPAGMALGAALVFWGIITSWVILLVGIGLFSVMLAGWIAAICHERKKT